MYFILLFHFLATHSSWLDRSKVGLRWQTFWKNTFFPSLANVVNRNTTYYIFACDCKIFRREQAFVLLFYVENSTNNAINFYRDTLILFSLSLSLDYTFASGCWAGRISLSNKLVKTLIGHWLQSNTTIQFKKIEAYLLLSLFKKILFVPFLVIRARKTDIHSNHKSINKSNHIFTNRNVPYIFSYLFISFNHTKK